MRRSLSFLVNFVPVFMPALSPSMENGTIVEWKKKVGELVKENEVFCTVQTDKAVVDYTNTFEDGYLAKILSNSGETVEVAKTIALMVDNADDIPKLANYSPEGAKPTAPSAAVSSPPPPEATRASTQAKVKQYGNSIEEAIAASGPGVKRIAACLDRQTLESLTPTGKGGRFVKSDFVGQPGFHYGDATPPLPSSSSSTITTTQALAAKSLSSSPSVAAVVTNAFPVYNFKVSDTTLLQQLLHTMPPMKSKGKEKKEKTTHV